MGEVNANLEKNITLLILIVGIMPLVWGTIVYWLMSKLWRQSRPGSRKHKSLPPLDYQI